MRVYLSGPIDSYGDRYENLAAFYAAERALRKRGWDVINPARIDEEYPPPQGMSYHQCRRFFMSRDLNVIMDDMYAEFGDVMFLLPNWTMSPGALAEVALARSLGMKVKVYREEE